MSDFDSLFNDFMNDKSNNKKNEAENFMDKLFNKLNNNSDVSDRDLFDHIKGLKNLASSLGEPDNVISYEEDGMYYQKMVWETEHGKVIKTVMSEVPFSEVKIKATVKKPRIPLEQQLETAVKEENYELAAKLRDRIAKRNANKVKK